MSTESSTNEIASSNGQNGNDENLDGFSQLQDLTSKRLLIDPSEIVLNDYINHMKMELYGRGETMIQVGAGSEGEDGDGLPAEDCDKVVASLEKVASKLDCSLTLLRTKEIEDGKETRDFLLRRRLEAEADFCEVRIAVVGNVDAGKSTLLGVLTHNCLDNGRGHARQKLFRHKHEIETGRTSSVGNEILGFDSNGKVVNTPSHGSSLDWTDICNKSSKVLTFVDLAGHEKYLKTTVFGLTGHLPDFCLIVVGSNAGMIGMAKEHLGLALALNLPVMCVVTKIDMTPPNVMKETLSVLGKLLRSSGVRKLPLLVQEHKHAVIAAQNFCSERVAPIFRVSSVTGEGLDNLKTFFNLLQPRIPTGKINDRAEFTVDDVFSVPGVGTVVSGTLVSGKVKAGDTMLMGPDSIGKFEQVHIKSIHRKRLPVQEVVAGQAAAFALKKIKKNQVRKGTAFIGLGGEVPKSVWEFRGEVVILHHPTTIMTNYQAMVHVGAVRQTAQITWMSTEALRTGDKAIVNFKFVKTPEWIQTGRRFVFREGRTKAVGTVVELVYGPPPADVMRNKMKHRKSNQAPKPDSNRSKRKQDIKAKTVQVVS